MRRHLKVALAIALASTAIPAAAQDPQPQSDEIVVTGQKEDPKAIGDFVKALIPVATGEKLGRFEHDVCPDVQGLAKAQADAVADRIRWLRKPSVWPSGKPAAHRMSSSLRPPTRRS